MPHESKDTLFAQLPRFFPDNLGDVSEEQSERFHQDIRLMEKRYQGRWNINMMADCCWSLQREIKQRFHNRRSNTRSFRDMRKRKRQPLM